jgi:hypothetical protein
MSITVHETQQGTRSRRIASGIDFSTHRYGDGRACMAPAGMNAPQHGVAVPPPVEATLRACEDKGVQPHRALTPVARGINRTFATVRSPRADADGR